MLINIARKLSLKLEIIKIENINFSFDDFKDFVDFPVDNHGMMMTSLLAKYCSKNGYRVVLTGMELTNILEAIKDQSTLI